MNAFGYRNFHDSMHTLERDSGASSDYKRGVLVTIYSILTGFHSHRFVEKLMVDNMPMYIGEDVIPKGWSFLEKLYEVSHSDCDGINVLKKKGK